MPQHKYQFVNWFPYWVGFGFKRWIGSMIYIYAWSLTLGFFEIRKWQTKSIKEINNANS